MPLKVFIGSSEEQTATAEFVVSFMVKHFREALEPLPWYQPWQGGQFTLETLLEMVAETDAAILLWSPEDEVNSRGRTTRSPRDNLIFEAGLFMAGQGRERARLLIPSDPKTGEVKKPTDIEGLTYHSYPASNGESLASSGLPATLREVCRQLAALTPRPRSSATLKDLQEQLGVERVQVLVGTWNDVFVHGMAPLAENPQTQCIDMVVAYQIGGIRRHLGEFRKRGDARLRMCFANLWDDKLVDVYRRKYYNRTVEELLSKLSQSISDLLGGCEITLRGDPARPHISQLQDPPGASYEVGLTDQRITFSYYRFDDVAFVIPLDMKRSQDPPPLAWVISKETCPMAFDRYLKEFDALFAEAHLVYPAPAA
jgi:hypothetical protein